MENKKSINRVRLKRKIDLNIEKGLEVNIKIQKESLKNRIKNIVEHPPWATRIS